MPAGHRDLLKSFGLSRNPFTDRTAEKTTLDGIAHYNHSDLQGFAPSGPLFVALRLVALCFCHVLNSRPDGEPITFPQTCAGSTHPLLARCAV